MFPLFCVFEKPWNFGSHQPLSTLIVILSGLEPELAGPVMRDGVLGSSTLVSWIFLFLVLGIGSIGFWLFWLWSSFFFVILKNLLAHQGTSGRATDFLQRPNFHRPRRTHLAWIGVPGTTSQLDSVCTSKIQFRLNTFLCKAVKQHLDPWTSCACSFPMKLKQLWLSWFATVGNRKSFWVQKCSQCFTTRSLLHFGLSSWVPDFKHVKRWISVSFAIQTSNQRHDPHRSIRSGQQKLLVLAKSRYRNGRLELNKNHASIASKWKTWFIDLVYLLQN